MSSQKISEAVHKYMETDSSMPTLEPGPSGSLPEQPAPESSMSFSQYSQDDQFAQYLHGKYSDDLRFADAKAVALTTVALAIATLSITFIKDHIRFTPTSPIVEQSMGKTASITITDNSLFRFLTYETREVATPPKEQSVPADISPAPTPQADRCNRLLKVAAFAGIGAGVLVIFSTGLTFMPRKRVEIGRNSGKNIYWSQLLNSLHVGENLKTYGELSGLKEDGTQVPWTRLSTLLDDVERISRTLARKYMFIRLALCMILAELAFFSAAFIIIFFSLNRM